MMKQTNLYVPILGVINFLSDSILHFAVEVSQVSQRPLGKYYLITMFLLSFIYTPHRQKLRFLVAEPLHSYI